MNKLIKIMVLSTISAMTVAAPLATASAHDYWDRPGPRHWGGPGPRYWDGPRYHDHHHHHLLQLVLLVWLQVLLLVVLCLNHHSHRSSIRHHHQLIIHQLRPIIHQAQLPISRFINRGHQHGIHIAQANTGHSIHAQEPIVVLMD